METSTALSPNVQSELAHRHKTTATTIVWLLIAVVLLCVLAFVSQKFLTLRVSPSLDTRSLDIAVRISILIFGLGAIALRRTQFANMRLQDIAALQGASGLLITLQRTTMRVAMIGILIALSGFVATLVSGITVYTYQAGVVAAAVLLYGYPVRSSWEQAIRRFALENGPDPMQK